ncbi:imidazole glycerol phosphate synthase subunit HisH [Rubritalea marina]|uniref:imidazole glycerol phosphate synthase subunit HisH n=1 Tax=Rubritalea marina TaxID=361055 RepID=UPI00037E691F|nr:imidazole glycerol phosphate synthase subunit HisH [Rubritalea marina]
MNVGIIDYGAGNLQSVLNAFKAVGAQAQLITAPEELVGLTHLVLPGQGEFGDCSRKLAASGMTQPLLDWIAADRPFMGICVGYQLLFEGSEESPDTPGLGVFKGMNVKFAAEDGLKVPHMGWNGVTPHDSQHTMWQGMSDEPYFYYVHSYFPRAEEAEAVACTTTYGNQTFHGAVTRGKLMATQFHPEKSQHAGLQLLKNFLNQ